MARYDKYDPISGGFRAKLAADLTPLTNGEFGPRAVSLNSSGLVVMGTAGTSGIAGVLVKNVARGPVGQWSTSLQGAAVPGAVIAALAGEVVDIMTNGEIVEVTGFTAGQKVFANPDGTLTGTSGTGRVPVGFMVTATRMVVRVAAGISPVV